MNFQSQSVDTSQATSYRSKVSKAITATRIVIGIRVLWAALVLLGVWAAVMLLNLLGDVIEAYKHAMGLSALPPTGTRDLSYEFFGFMGVIVAVALVLSLFPLFLQQSFQYTKKNRIRGDVWTDLVCLGYWTKLRYSADVNQRIEQYDLRLKQEHSHLSKLKGKIQQYMDPVGQTTLARAPDESTDTLAVALDEFSHRFEEHYGGRAFLWPLLLSTFLSLLGWVTVLLPFGVSEGPTESWSGLSRLMSGGFGGYTAEVASGLNAVSAAFLGAYFFNIQALFRRYVRSDFKPTAVTQACLRIITGWIVAFVVATTVVEMSSLSRPYVLLLGFFTGIFSLQILGAVWSFLSGRSSRFKLLRLVARWFSGRNTELTDLDGLDSWHVDRLDEAGINYVRGLATADFLDLLLSVRLPTETLVDWVDQAILRMHVNDALWDALCAATSVRTASDLIDVSERDTFGTTNGTQALVDVLNHALVQKKANIPAEITPALLHLLAKSLRQDPNIDYICTFRAQIKHSVTHADAFPGGWPLPSPVQNPLFS